MAELDTSNKISHKTELSKTKRVIKDLLPHVISTEKTTDDDTLIDIHVGNPFHKFMLFLQSLKRQKAFSFEIKGSIGITGVVILVAGFGIFGWANMMGIGCSKGNQTFLGSIRQLQIKNNTTSSTIPLAQRFSNIFNPNYATESKSDNLAGQLILISPNQTIMQIILKIKLAQLNIIQGNQYLISGNYNACTQSLTVTTTSAIETYQ